MWLLVPSFKFGVYILSTAQVQLQGRAAFSFYLTTSMLLVKARAARRSCCYGMHKRKPPPRRERRGMHREEGQASQIHTPLLPVELSWLIQGNAIVYDVLVCTAYGLWPPCGSSMHLCVQVYIYTPGTAVPFFSPATDRQTDSMQG